MIFINQINWSQARYIRSRLKQAHRFTRVTLTLTGHFLVTFAMHHRRKWHFESSTPISPDFIFILWGQSTWILVKAFQERGGSEGGGGEGSVKAWKAGGRVTLLVHASGWRENAEYRKYSKFILKFSFLAKSSFTKKKHRNMFLLLVYSLPKRLWAGACTESKDRSMQSCT